MKVSVVISTRNRAASLIRCLQSIEVSAGRASLRDAEIVVTDNASDDDTSSAVTSWAAGASVPVRLEYEPRPGITIAKNRGLRRASGDILVLTDDDCRLREDFFANLLALYATKPDMALRGGRVELGNAMDLPLTIKTDTIGKRWHLSNAPARHENLGNCFLGCNLSMIRAAYQRLGPFDETFGVGRISAGEDTEYIFRAYAAGFTLEYVPELVAFHHHGRRTPVEARRLWRNYVIASGALYAKYVFKCPSLCRQFQWDLKCLIREALSRENLFLPEYSFSYADKFGCYASGAASYFRAMMERQRQQS